MKKSFCTRSRALGMRFGHRCLPLLKAEFSRLHAFLSSGYLNSLSWNVPSSHTTKQKRPSGSWKSLSFLTSIQTFLWTSNSKIMIPWWLRAMRPREQERERDSKLSAHLGTPALSTNLKATAYCKNVLEEEGSKWSCGKQAWKIICLSTHMFTFSHADCCGLLWLNAADDSIDQR